MLIEKSRSGVYQDTSENRRLHRVGQHYGEQKQPEEKKGNDGVRDVEIVTSKQGIKVFLSGKVGGDYYKAVAEAYKALRRHGKSKTVDTMLKESGSGSPSKDVPAKKYVEAIADGASHDEAVAFADDCYEELLAKIKNVQEKVYSEGVSQSASSKMFAAVNKWFKDQKFEKQAVSESEVLPEVNLSEKAFMRHVDEEMMEEWPDAKMALHYYQAPEIEYFDNAGNKKKASPFINEFYANSRQDSVGGYEIYFDKSDSIGTFRTKEQAVDALNRYINAMRVKDHTEPEWVYHQSKGQYQWNYSMPTSPSANKQKEQELKDKIAESEARKQKQIELPKSKNAERIFAAINGNEFAMKKLSRNDVLGEVRLLETRRKDAGIANADPDRFKSADKNTLLVRFKELYNDTVSYNKTGVSSLAAAEQAAAKKQAEEIDRGVRAAEEKRNLEEIKRTNEKMNAAMKEQSNVDKKSAETSEKPTSRVTFADVPHAKDVNLKKYLTDSRRKEVDALMKTVEVMPKTAVKQAHDAAVKKFNDNFDNLKKSERASALYVIMKYKDFLMRK